MYCVGLFFDDKIKVCLLGIRNTNLIFSFYLITVLRDKQQARVGGTIFFIVVNTLI